MGHFEQERQLQRDVEQALEGTLDDVAVLDLELDAARGTVRIYVDAPDGVDHGLCARVTQELDEVRSRYSLEVSSPGIERPLRYAEHFRAATGERVKLRRRGGGRRPFTATVAAAGDDAVELVREDGTRESIPYNDIARTHLVVDVQVGRAASGKGGTAR